MSFPVTLEDVNEAHERIAKHIHRTPVFTCETIDNIVQRNVFFKAENLQKTGSFKPRGALNSILKLKEENSNVAGVVTHSSGNHGMAVAWAARKAGIPCTVVVARGTPEVKIQAIKGYGADLVICEPSPTSRVETCDLIAKEKGYFIVHSYDSYNTIAGQGTMAVEFLEEVPELDAILVAISGGGMTAGVAVAAKAIKPNIKIFAVEAYGKELEPCLKANTRLWRNPPQFIDTIAEGIRIQQVGHKTFPIVCELVEKQVFTVTDDEMVEAMKFTWQRMKLMIEASSAAGVHAVMSEQMRQLDPSLKNIGVILCGGNVDVNNLPW
ncbi:unnamed protein product [Owenia fusiformis]|uniref:Serine racemase n=2 Tax=Owenia fusiformis TaxID=6347 RepID=A0A8J1Y5Y6_OWEFU|nr:unnamed protein product [Owenia fusiformis]